MTDGQVGSFSAQATKFFAGLERDNSKDYWTANKPVFEKEVKEPMAGSGGLSPRAVSTVQDLPDEP